MSLKERRAGRVGLLGLDGVVVMGSGICCSFWACESGTRRRGADAIFCRLVIMYVRGLDLESSWKCKIKQ